MSTDLDSLLGNAASVFETELEAYNAQRAALIHNIEGLEAFRVKLNKVAAVIGRPAIEPLPLKMLAAPATPAVAGAAPAVAAVPPVARPPRQRRAAGGGPRARQRSAYADQVAARMGKGGDEGATDSEGFGADEG